MLFVLLYVLQTPLLHSQTLQVYSEFRRFDEKGQLIAQDREGTPREILSPGLIRNGYHSLRIVVRPPKPQHYALLLAQNPEDSVRMKLYRELPASPGVPIPDRLELVAKLPFEWDGTAIHTFWLDIFTPADAIVRRVRIEAQVHDGTGWIIYPMEVRILKGIVPKVRTTTIKLPPATAPSDQPARLALHDYVCDGKSPTAPAANQQRGFIFRNAEQDIALARALQVRWSRELLFDKIAQTAGAENTAAFCASPPTNSPSGPEWYLKVRDFLYREASR